VALVESIDIPLGSPFIPFELPDPDGKQYPGNSLFGPKGLLMVFTCNHCPYAIAVWPRVIQISEEAKKLGINTIAINPNIHPSYPEDAPEKMKEKIKEWGIAFPYLVDETQQVSSDYKAQCTPDLYLFDGEKKLAYHGRIDDNWKDETKVTRQELKEAIKNLAAGKPVSKDQKPSMGCSIKWK
jgi:peroxiredoxin